MAIDLVTEERILLGLFLCSNTSNEILQLLKPEWNKIIDLPAEEKLRGADIPYLINDVFPWQNQLSDGIDDNGFYKSFFIQPDLFLRIRPGHEFVVKNKLTAAGTSFFEKNRNCISVSNTSKVDTIIELDTDAVIQDFNSQRTGEFIQSAIDNIQPPVSAWDCCAASGGKSIMLYDITPVVKLTVSDIRESILSNLKKRFARAGIRKYKSFIIDLSTPPIRIITENYNLVIADVPCSGSGTWSRTPEQLYFFTRAKIAEYHSLQKKIVDNAARCLQEGGYILYITCSVFKMENEEVVGFLQEKHNLRLARMELLKGYDQKADTLFAALLYKPL